MIEIRFNCSKCNTTQTEYFGDYLGFEVIYPKGDSYTIECECENCFHKNEILLRVNALEFYGDFKEAKNENNPSN